MAWTLVNKTPNTNLGYSYYPAVWEDSGKVYVKAQGETDINVYDVANDAWSTLMTVAALGEGYPRFESCPCRQELIWVANDSLYIWTHRDGAGSGVRGPFLAKFSMVGVLLSDTKLYPTFGNIDGFLHGNWGRNRHKSVIKEPVSGRIFLINFYLKKIYEFVASTEAFVLVKTWTEGIGGNSTDDVAGCDAVAMNGNIYLLGSQNSSYNNAYVSTGPVEINITNWSSTTLAAYPDYAAQVSLTNNGIIDAAWLAIGNSIFGYGGNIHGWEAGGALTLATLMRSIQFNPGDNAWSDLGTIPAALLYAGATSYENSGYLFGGYELGAATQKTGNIIYLLEAIDSMTLAFDPADGSVTVTWTDTSGQDLTGYLVERREQQGSVWTTVGSGAAADRTMTDNTAVLGHDYYYQVRPYFVQVS